MISELFQPTSRFGRCLQFFRHMYGASIGSLNVYIKYGPGNSSDAETLIWSDSGNQGDSWIQSQVPVYSSNPYRVCFFIFYIKHLKQLLKVLTNFFRFILI